MQLQIQVLHTEAWAKQVISSVRYPTHGIFGQFHQWKMLQKAATAMLICYWVWYSCFLCISNCFPNSLLNIEHSQLLLNLWVPLWTQIQLQPIQNIVHFLKEGSCGGGLVSGCFPTYTLFKVKHFIMRLPGCSSIKDAVRNTQDVLFSSWEVIVPWTMNSLEITSFRKCWLKYQTGCLLSHYITHILCSI